MIKKFRYTGAQPHLATIRVKDKQVDLRLFKGEDIELDSEHPHVKSLVATGHLIDVNNIKKP